MISESKTMLPAFGKSRGKILFRFDFVEFKRDDQSFYRFHYVAISPPAIRARLIDAVIADKYSKSAEIGLINNRDLDDKGANEYQEYQTFRAQAKLWIDAAL